MVRNVSIRHIWAHPDRAIEYINPYAIARKEQKASFRRMKPFVCWC